MTRAAVTATRRQSRARARFRLVTTREHAAPASRTSNRRLVLWLLGCTTVLTLTGLVMVLSASSVSAFVTYGSSFVFFQRQSVYALVGIAGLVAAARTPYAAWQRVAAPLYVGSLVLLVLVLHPAAGHEAGGSARWIEFGPVMIQPSEVAKLAVVTLCATVLAKKWKKLGEPSHLLLPLLPTTGLVCVLVMLQPDLGTTVVIAGAVFVLVFAAGVRLRYLLMGALVGGLLGFVLIMSADYRRARFFSFLNPWADPQNTGYQLIQSLIALGSGGWTGVGIGASRQKWMYVPNSHTDFIFSILGEELGLLGEIAVLLLFAGLLFAGIRIAFRAPDVFGRLLATGVVAWLGLQTVVNLGAVTGLLPVTGVPLPFVSFGGSSLVVSLTAVGILVSIARAGSGGRDSRTRVGRDGERRRAR